MAKRKASAKKKSAKRSTSRPSVKRARAATRKSARARRPAARKKSAGAKKRAESVPVKRPMLDRQRRTLDDVVPTPPSSLNMDQHGSAARSGRAEMADKLRKRGSISRGITSGDVDADYENAYFSGDEAPGGDNPTPDQDVVEDIGKALGVEYNDNEELKSSEKLSERDKHRWELDPASSEDYRDRK